MDIVQGTVSNNFINYLISQYPAGQGHHIRIKDNSGNQVHEKLVFLRSGDGHLETAVENGDKGDGFELELTRGEDITITKVVLESDDDNMGVVATFDLYEKFPYGGDFEVGSIKINFE